MLCLFYRYAKAIPINDHLYNADLSECKSSVNPDCIVSCMITTEDLQTTSMMCPKVKKKISNWDAVLNKISESNWKWENNSWTNYCPESSELRLFLSLTSKSILQIIFRMDYSNTECLKKAIIISRNSTQNILCFKLNFDNDLSGARATIKELNGRHPEHGEFHVYERKNIPADELKTCRSAKAVLNSNTGSTGTVNSKTDSGAGTLNITADDLFNLDDMYMVIPKYQYGLYHFRISIESSFSFCNLSVSILFKQT